jgi:hypothetical protein
MLSFRSADLQLKAEKLQGTEATFVSKSIDGEDDEEDSAFRDPIAPSMVRDSHPLLARSISIDALILI